MRGASTITAGLILIAWLILCPAGVFGQPERTATDDLLLEKIRVMEAQLEQLSNDLASMKAELAAKDPKAGPSGDRKDDATEPPAVRPKE
ncbi:MAG: hypothetical protein J5I65_06990 [Aridibacter famidurans]|nr:hypothetical protein [Aridibacter famidurans]